MAMGMRWYGSFREWCANGRGSAVAQHSPGVVCQIFGWHTTWQTTWSHAKRIAKEFSWIWPLVLLRWLAIGYGGTTDTRVFTRPATSAILVAGVLVGLVRRMVSEAGIVVPARRDFEDSARSGQSPTLLG